jgi:[protein-PII] uridylyltransferase
VQWEVRQASDLRLHGFIDDEEYADLSRALDFLWRMRNELHRKGRKDDRLHYEAQERFARLLGLRDTTKALAVESLMRSYYMHARVIERVSRRAVEHALAVLERRKHRAPAPPQAVAEGFVIADGNLEIPRGSVLVERPVRMLAAFATAQHHDVELSVRAQRTLRSHLHLIDDGFRSSAEAAAMFHQILSAPVRVYRSLKLMDELGILGAYIPEFSSLVGLWQQDMYHTYTVDVHSLFLVEQLRRLQRNRYRRELPLPSALMREVRAPAVLFLGCILHDIGKGRGGGHSQKGATMVPSVAERLHLDAEEAETVQFLVRHHLTMSAMAESRNVHDARVILRLCNLARTRERLRLLYLLTVADIRSVSPEAWTTWKAGLLEALYRNAAEWIEASNEPDAADGFFLKRASRQVGARQREVLALLETRGAASSPGQGDVERARLFLDAMPRRYLLSNEAPEIADQVEAGLHFLASGRRLAVYAFRPAVEKAAFWGLMLFARDQLGLFSRTAGVLSSFGHNILSAQIYTSRESLAVDIYHLSPIAGGPEEEEVERARIEERLRRVLEEGAEIPVAARPRGGAAHARRQKPRVRFSNRDSDFYTIVEVMADDRPGLLYDITRTLTELNLDVVMSWASTRAQRVMDVFYVTDEGHKVRGGARRDQIREALLKVLERPEV